MWKTRKNHDYEGFFSRLLHIDFLTFLLNTLADTYFYSRIFVSNQRKRVALKEIILIQKYSRAECRLMSFLPQFFSLFLSLCSAIVFMFFSDFHWYGMPLFHGGRKEERIKVYLHDVCEHSEFLFVRRMEMEHPSKIHCIVSLITSSLHNIFLQVNRCSSSSSSSSAQLTF